jgi:cholestenol delta-isomerase
MDLLHRFKSTFAPSVSSMAEIPIPTPEFIQPLHPYYPLEAEIVGYLANEWNTVQLCSMFASGCAVIFVLTYTITTRVRPNVSVGDLATVMWFVLCGCIHLFFEGYFAWNFDRMGGRQDLFGQLWKEYSLSDSRYLTRDAFVLCMESITAVSLPFTVLATHVFAIILPC